MAGIHHHQHGGTDVYDDCCQPAETTDPHDRERKVLVGRIYSNLSSTWTEQKEDTFDEVVQRMSERRTEHAPKVSADEIIEVIVVRRARISSTVSVEEI